MYNSEIYMWSGHLRKLTCIALTVIQAKFGSSMFIMFRRWGERPNERVITVGIGLSSLEEFAMYIMHKLERQS